MPGIFTTFVSNFVYAFFMALPWVAIGLMAVLAWRKRGDSKLLLQAGGAFGMFVITIGQTFIAALLSWLQFYNVMSGERIIYQFLIFVALAAFAAGYCMERFTTRKHVAA